MNADCDGDSPRYQKLHGECCKLKAQLLVLKSSYQEEQTKSQTLGERLREQDGQTKKLNRELDSLTFQNRQLSKKVAALQGDLAEASGGTAKSSRPNANAAQSAEPVFTIEEFSVLDAELQGKIHENERLHREHEEARFESGRQVRQLTGQLEQLRLDCDGRLKELQELLEIEQQRSDRLTQDKSRLEAKLIEYLAEMQQSKAQCGSRIVIEQTPVDRAAAAGDQPARKLEAVEKANAKLLEMLDKYELAESRALSFEVETRMLENRLEVAEQELRESLLRAQELRTSVKHYEAQLNVMSEYVATLDEKLVRQKDEIDELRATAAAVKKQGKGK